MKPHLLYALPRSRSTAIMLASRRPQKLFEPFNYKVALRGATYHFGAESQWWKNWNLEAWESLKTAMAQPDTVTKFFGSQIHLLPWSQPWWQETRNSDQYEIFVIYRPLREIIQSYILAPHFGYFSVEPYEPEGNVMVGEDAFYGIERDIKTFMYYLPEAGRVISWEHLPEEHFDRTKVYLEDQQSSTKLHRIKNLDYCQTRIDTLVNKYQNQYQDRVFSLPWA